MKFIPPEFWPEIKLGAEPRDWLALILECLLVFFVCLLVAGFTGLLAGLVWGWLA